MSLGHSVKHQTCNKVHRWWKMHEYSEKCLNTCSNCHMEPTQEQSPQMGLSPIKDFEKISQKLRTPTQFQKSPILNPNLNFNIISENMKKMFRKTYLEVILQRFLLENEEVWVKNGFGLKGVRESLSEGNENDLKTYHICLIKLKTRIFRGLESHEISRETYWSFREKLLVAKQSR